MFSFNVFSSHLELTSAIISSVIVCYVFLKMSVAYTLKRANRNYAQEKTQAPSITSFKTLSKLLFVSSMLLTLLNYWLSSSMFLTLYKVPALQFTGALLVLFGYVNLNRAFGELGGNYSPLFDAYLPSTLIMTGLYRFIRHPIYLFNLFVSFGLAISSGSLIITINAVIGLLFILRAISVEESYLNQHFPNYYPYSKKSWRLLPFLY